MLTKQSLYSLTYEQLAGLLNEQNISSSNAKGIFKKIYKIPCVGEQSHGPSLSGKALSYVDSNYEQTRLKVVKTLAASDGTVKFLFDLGDGNTIESVLIPFARKYTVCLSTQVGCAMGCEFCFTARMKKKRNLESFEIVAQYMAAWEYLREHVKDKCERPNIVYMGQGEPLDNFDELHKSIEIFTQEHGLYLSPRQITVSTVGPKKGLERLTELPGVNIAYSLHAASDEKRKSLIPLANSINIADSIALLEKVPLRSRQFINYEYILIAGVNDSPDDMYELANLLRGRKAIVNLIPFNPFPGSEFKKPDVESVELFKNNLCELGVRAMVRTTKGDEILAACGQLNAAAK